MSLTSPTSLSSSRVDRWIDLITLISRTKTRPRPSRERGQYIYLTQDYLLEVIVSVRCLGAIASFLSLAIRIPSVSTRWILVSDICPFLGIYSITTAVGDLLLLGLGRMLSLAQICRES